MEKEQQFVNTLVPTETLKRVKEFQFAQKFNTRAEAIRFLLNWALDNYEEK